MLKLLLSGLITRIRAYYMSSMLEKQIYAGIMAVLNDRNAYYQSGVGSNGAYNHLTDSGKEAILTYIEQFAPLMVKKQQLELDARAKQLVINELKK